MSILLALFGALAYGLSDFVGGVFSRRTSTWPIAFTACVGAAVGSLVLALAVPGEPHRSDVLWGLLAGIGSGAGTVFLYRGFASGRMGVVAPVSAVGAVVLPVGVGLISGEQPSVVVWLGIVIALPGIWLVSREPTPDGAPGGLAGGLRDGVLAGVGFGLLFSALGQVPDVAGYWPLLGTQVVSFLVVALAAVVLGQHPLPRQRGEWGGLVAGALASAAVLGFLLARHGGMLSVAAVVTSLYPAFTVLLATLFLGERLHRAQSLGLALCAVTVVCVALG